MVQIRDVYAETTRAAIIGSIGTAAWWGVKNLGFSNRPTIAPLAIGIAGATYSIAHKVATEIFNRIFRINAETQNYRSTLCYFVIQLTSASISILTIHAIGLLTFSTYALGTALELVLFLKGTEFLISKLPEITHYINRFVDRQPQQQEHTSRSIPPEPNRGTTAPLNAPAESIAGRLD